jgi:hypothetical protein
MKNVLIGIAVVLLTMAVTRTAYGNGAARLSPSDSAPSMDYRWWQHASEDERLTAIAVAVQGLRAGWTFGANGQLGAISKNLNDAYAHQKISLDAIEIATKPRPFTPPVFTRPLGTYRTKIDNAYRRVPSMRAQDVALVLLCFSDTQILTCRDAHGTVMR